ncbi:MAG TPA: PLP-dependent aminotransferase family protein [Acidimicrobiales bacterium]|nr:PLP-dependent aminotransferase family protein [Acidimicrobiales bacterium]
MARSADLRRLVGTLGEWAAGPGPLFRQLSRAVAGAIESGALAEGLRLPSERVLASALFVSRGTTVAAYDLLVTDGLVERRHGSGTYVAGAGALGLPDGREGSALVHRLVERSTARSGVIDLSISVLHDAGGLPDVTLSSGDLRAMVPETGYSPWGSSGLRALVADRVSGWGLPTTPGQVVITSGAQQGISAAAACWLRPGDTVVVEDPCYPGAIAAFAQAGAQLVGVPVDGEGVLPDELGHALSARPALVYLQPTVQSPTGTVLSAARRRRVAELVRRYRVPMVEDVALADLCWAPAPPPVAFLCPEASVAVVGSLSKVLWGGIRLGFVRAPEPLALRFARVKATSDLGTSAVSQMLAERLLSGRPGVWRLRSLELRRRYEVLAASLTDRLSDWRWSEPAGGLSVWVSLGGIDAERFAQIALRHGVAVATATPLSVTDCHGDRIRLSFAAPPGILRQGVERLRAAWDTVGVRRAV